MQLQEGANALGQAGVAGTGLSEKEFPGRGIGDPAGSVKQCLFV